MFVSALSRAFREFPAVCLCTGFGWAVWVSSARPAASCSRRGRAEGPGGLLTKAGWPASRHQNFYQTAALNARQTSQTERRSRAGNSRPCLRLDSQLEPKPPLDVHFPCVKKNRCQLATWPTDPDKTRDCAPATDDRNTRHPAAVSRAAARTAPSPSLHFRLIGFKAARATRKDGT